MSACTTDKDALTDSQQREVRELCSGYIDEQPGLRCEAFVDVVGGLVDEGHCTFEEAFQFQREILDRVDLRELREQSQECRQRTFRR